MPPALEMLSVYVELASVSALVTVTVTVVDLPLSGMGGVGIPLATARLFTAMRQLGTAGSAVIATEATRFCSATVYALVLGEKAGCGNKLEFLVWFLAIIFELECKQRVERSKMAISKNGPIHLPPACPLKSSAPSAAA